MTIASPFPKPRYGRAFAVAWLIYMAAAFSEPPESPLSLIGQPIMGAVFGGIVVGLVALLGLVLRVPAVGLAWFRNKTLPLILIIGSLLLMMFGSSLGLSEAYFEYDDPEFQREFHRLHPGVAFPAYVIVVFAVAFWPGSKTSPPAV